MSERKMQVKINNKTSSSYNLIGGFPQGSLIGQLLYIIGSDDAAEEVNDENKFKYVDDLATLDAVNIKEHLTQYDFWQHVPSDIATDEKYLPPETFKSQTIIAVSLSISSPSRFNLVANLSLFLEKTIYFDLDLLRTILLSLVHFTI